MKIYVSGQLADVENIKEIQNKLIGAGHEITHDWTINEVGKGLLDTPEKKLKDTSETARRAKNDIQGVIDSDIFIICTNNEKAGKGMYVELGAALALQETTSSPSIYLIGNMNHMSVFYLHPAINKVDTVEEVIEKLNNERNN